ncbi:MAG: ABC transporter ATP-binding protein [Rikenellaceae bacterium]|nr:ABC transporter ATP-binding protein [Rikenellaceae bacterium]
MTQHSVIQLENVSVGYGPRQLLTADAAILRGELCALIGRNGTGKSSLLRMIAGITPATEGRIAIEGVDLAGLSPRRLASLVSFVSTERISVTNLRVRDVVALGRTPYTNWFGSLTSADHAIVDEAMARLGVEHFADKRVSTLSDGENARVMIARALAQQTPVILLDEPTAFLDIAGKYELCEILSGLCRDGKTILFSSHDLSTVWNVGCSVALIYNGALHHGNATEMKSSPVLTEFFRNSGFRMDFSTGVLHRIE